MMAQYTQSVQQELHSGSHSYTKNFSAVASGTDLIATPGYHKSIFLTDLIISNGVTAGYFRFYDNVVTASVVQRINLAINGLFVSNFSGPLQITPNMGFEVYSTTADDFSVTINYYIDEVKGFGYSSGGTTGSASNVIGENYFASDSNSTDVGDLTLARWYCKGQSSAVSGYSCGGEVTGTQVNTIDKFSFSTGGDATDVGDLTVARYGVAPQSSAVSGYSSGGYTGSASATIDKFSFSSDGDATDVGDLTVARFGPAGQSSTVSGYSSGGYTGSASATVDKFSFSSDANATDVGDLTLARYGVAGQQSN